MGEPSSLKKIIEKIKSVKNYEIIIAILIISIIVSIFVSSIDKPSISNANNENTSYCEQPEDKVYTAEEQQEIKLQEKLSAIKGAGEVEVMITYKSGREVVTAMNTIQSNTTTEEQDRQGGVRKVTQNDVNTQAVTTNEANGSKPLVIKEMEPEVKGVIVIAEGADDVMVKMELLRAVQIALGVDANQVEVFVMESRDKE